MSDLTEQWKKGELESGYYYIKNNNEDIYFDEYDSSFYKDFNENKGSWENHYDDEISEILAPVPSYEEWKSLNEILDSSLQTNKALVHRLNLCKELLKECKHIMNIEKDFASCHFEKHKLGELLTKIDEVLK